MKDTDIHVSVIKFITFGTVNLFNDLSTHKIFYVVLAKHLKTRLFTKEINAQDTKTVTSTDT